MNLPRKLQHWVDANLITSDQRTQIIDHEKNRSGSLLKYGLGYIGAFSILQGIVLVVSSNWQIIPDAVKLGGHFAINIILAALVYMWRDNPNRLVQREGALFAFWGLSMTLIALIGQVFQLSGEAFDAARLWFWITTPMVLYFAQGRYISALWAIFFVIYVPFEIFFTLLKDMDDQTAQAVIAIIVMGLMPIALWTIGAWPRLRKLRNSIAASFRNLGFLWATVAASAAGIMFYGSFNTEMQDISKPAIQAAAFITIIITGIIGLFLHRAKWLDSEDRGISNIVCLAAAMSVMPAVFMISNDLLAMLHFVFLWLAIGYLAQRDNIVRLVNLAILLVTVRLFVGFLELFGGLLESGYSFIVIGCVLFALLHGARVVKRTLKERAPA